jgi:bifunctional DNA-binding transcriptional regulator/antitoxin component of YhaV-PrlF toxin-antitoxin module
MENMQLQRQLSRKHKEKIYPKFTIVIPPKEIEKLGWKEGEELEPEIDDNRLIIKLKNRKNFKIRRIT